MNNTIVDFSNFKIRKGIKEKIKLPDADYTREKASFLDYYENKNVEIFTTSITDAQIMAAMLMGEHEDIVRVNFIQGCSRKHPIYYKLEPITTSGKIHSFPTKSFIEGIMIWEDNVEGILDAWYEESESED